MPKSGNPPSLVFGTMSSTAETSGSAAETVTPTIGDVTAHAPTGWADATPILITGHKLNGLNFLQWHQSVYMFICGKGKDDYLTGVAPAPALNDPTYKKWKAENHMVMSWLINSMTTDIGENFLLYQTAQEIWEAARETYSTQEKSAEIFEVESLLQDLKQGDMLVNQYYNSLTKFWQKLDLLENYSWSCPADAANFKKITEQKRLYKFLLGLSDMFEEVRSRILGRTTLPSLKEAFSEIRREESRKKLSQGASMKNPLEHSALATRGPDQRISKQGHPPNRPWCDYCRKKGHTRDTCWQIHGKPANWKPRQQGSTANNAETLTNTAPFSQEQLDLLQKLFTSNLPPSTGNIAQSGNFSSALTTGSQTNGSWIVDSGASDHMTGNSSLFSSLLPCKTLLHVKIADGTMAKVSGIGTVKISSNLNLLNVLYVPSLSCNLLSISKLTQDNQCCANFHSNGCVFQDKASGKMIGSAKECNGLYLLGSTPFNVFNKWVLNVNCPGDILLWHFRLGHPNFQYMRKVYPDLFNNKSSTSFQCEICQLSKHTRATYPTQPYKPSQPFSLIHSDVWGPSNVPNISGSKWFVTFVDDHTRLTWAFLMEKKSEVPSIFKSFHKLIKTQFNAKIQVLRSDNGREFFNNDLNTYLAEEGILHQSSCVYTPQQNGVAERKNRHILEIARSLLITSNTPKTYWGDAVLSAIYLINRMPSRIIDYHTPYNKFLSFFPSTRALNSIPPKIFGCTAFVHSYTHNKLDPKAIKCLFLGYSSTQKGYKCYSPSLKKTFITMDVTFFEKEPFFSKTSIQGETLEE